MEPRFQILAAADNQTPARFLLTNPESERDFLLFSQSITVLEQSMVFYTNIVGLCGTYLITWISEIVDLFITALVFGQEIISFAT